MYVTPCACYPFTNPAVDEIEGYDVTVGLTGWANKPAKKDAFVCSNITSIYSIIFSLSFIINSSSLLNSKLLAPLLL
jgi:hypothetical protein